MGSYKFLVSSPSQSSFSQIKTHYVGNAHWFVTGNYIQIHVQFVIHSRGCRILKHAHFADTDYGVQPLQAPPSLLAYWFLGNKWFYWQ